VAYKLSKQQPPKYLGLMHAEYWMKISKFDERESVFYYSPYDSVDRVHRLLLLFALFFCYLISSLLQYSVIYCRPFRLKFKYCCLLVVSSSC